MSRETGLAKGWGADAPRPSQRRRTRLLSMALVSKFGTFRHWYIAAQKQEALTLQRMIQTPDTAEVAHAKLIHELYHFKTGDYWQLGYTTELLETTIKVMAVAGAFYLGTGMMLWMARGEMLTIDASKIVGDLRAAAETISHLIAPVVGREVSITIPPRVLESLHTKIEQLPDMAAKINFQTVLTLVISSVWVFVGLGASLWWFLRPKLWRIREFYADAGVVRTQGSASPLSSTLRGDTLDESCLRGLLLQASAYSGSFVRIKNTAIDVRVPNAIQPSNRRTNLANVARRVMNRYTPGSPWRTRDEITSPRPFCLGLIIFGILFFFIIAVMGNVSLNRPLMMLFLLFTVFVMFTLWSASIGLFIYYRAFFLSGVRWTLPILALILSERAVSLPIRSPAVLLLFRLVSITSFFAIVITIALHAWHRDIGLPLIACGAVIGTTLMARAWHVHGNLTELLFSNLTQPEKIPLFWEAIFFNLFLFFILPLGIISFIRHTVRLIQQELR